MIHSVENGEWRTAGLEPEWEKDWGHADFSAYADRDRANLFEEEKEKKELEESLQVGFFTSVGIGVAVSEIPLFVL